MLSGRVALKYLAFVIAVAFVATACEKPIVRSQEDVFGEIEAEAALSADGVSDASPDAADLPTPVVESLIVAGGSDEQATETEAETEPTLAPQLQAESQAAGEQASPQPEAEEPVTPGTPSVEPESEQPEADREESEEEGPDPENAEPRVSATPDSSSGTGENQPADDVPSNGEESLTFSHTVQPGESLYRIALLYEQSWVTLAQINNLPAADYIYPGQVLLIPDVEPPLAVAEAATGTFYTVNPGDSLLGIANAFGLSWIEVAEANGILNPNQIAPGQVLKIPVSAPGPSPEFTHEVRLGQTLYSISLIYGVPITAIAQANGLTTPYIIYAGQTLIIPSG